MRRRSSDEESRETQGARAPRSARAAPGDSRGEREAERAERAEPAEPAERGDRKERVIHTRVPERLEAQLRRRAEDLGISVSNLVRNVLGHAFGLVGDVVADGQAIARAARGEPARPAAPMAPATPPPPAWSTPAAAPATFDDVLGWQPILLGKNAVCVRCNAILPRGTDAAVGVGTQLVACPACVEELRS